MRIVLFMLSFLWASEAVSVVGDRNITNQNLNRDLFLCGTRSTGRLCPAYVNTGNQAFRITSGIIENTTITGAITSDVTISPGTLGIGGAAPNGTELYVIESDSADFRVVESGSGATAQVRANANGASYGSATSHNTLIGSNGLSNLIIDTDGRFSIRADNNSASDFGHIPLMITGASSWTPNLNTGTAATPNGTLMLGPSSGTDNGEIRMYFDSGVTSGSARVWVDEHNTFGTWAYRFQYATGTDSFTDAFIIDLDTGIMDIMVSGAGGSSNSGDSCSPSADGMDTSNVCSGSSGSWTFGTVSGCSSSSTPFVTSISSRFQRTARWVTYKGRFEISGGVTCNSADTVEFNSHIYHNGSTFNNTSDAFGKFVCDNGTTGYITPVTSSIKLLVTFNGTAGAGVDCFYDYGHRIPGASSN